MRRSWCGPALVAALCLAISAIPAAAGTVQSQKPYWFRDGYTSTTSVNLAASTAVVDTAGTGTVRLPYAPLQAAFDPAGTYALVATAAGVSAWVFDGQAVHPVTAWSLGNLAGATGVAWAMRGRAFAVATGSQVAVYGLSAGSGGYAASRVAQTAFTGAIGLAPGPASLPSALLVATATGASVLEAQGSSLVALSGGPAGLAGNLGVAATTGGAVAATWQAEAVQLWTWDGAAYLPAHSWDPPTPPLADGPVVGVAFDRGSDGQGGTLWVLTQGGQMLGYAYGPAGLQALPAWSVSVAATPNPPAGIAAGWGRHAVAVLYPTGWTYEDLVTGNTFGQDSIRSLGGQTWAVYQPSAVLQSVVLPVGHAVDEVRIEDADCAAGKSPPSCTGLPSVPAGTSVAYQVSTDGCHTWTDAPVFTNVTAPAGSSLCYRITLSTTDPAQTPVIDVTNLYEIAAVTTVESPGGPAVLCLGTGCA